MNSNGIQYRDTREVALESVLALYRANEWSSAQTPELLHKALSGSHSLLTAWDGTRLVGLGNAISDGYLVVYYPHLLVLPEYQGRGLGTELMRRLMARYPGFHQHMLVADGRALDFYQKCGFERAGKTEPCGFMQGTITKARSASPWLLGTTVFAFLLIPNEGLGSPEHKR